MHYHVLQHDGSWLFSPVDPPRTIHQLLGAKGTWRPGAAGTLYEIGDQTPRMRERRALQSEPSASWTS